MAGRKEEAEAFLKCIEEGKLEDSLAHFDAYASKARADEMKSLYAKARTALADLLLSGKDFDWEDLRPICAIDAAFWTKLDREHYFLSFEAVNDALARLKGITEPVAWASACLYAAWIAGLTVASGRLGLRPVTILLKGRSFDLKECVGNFDRKFPDAGEVRDAVGYSMSWITDLWYVFDGAVSRMEDRDVYIFDSARKENPSPLDPAPMIGSVMALIAAPADKKQEAVDAMDREVKGFVRAYLSFGDSITGEQRKKYGEGFDSVKSAVEAQRKGASI